VVGIGFIRRVDVDSPQGAYVFVRSGVSWSQQQKLAGADTVDRDGFGWSVAVIGNTAVVGAPYKSGTASQAGAAYVFARSGAVWSQQQKLTASDAAGGALLGWSVAVSGETAVVGAYGDDDAGHASGSAYVFVRSSGAWSQQQKLTASDPAALSAFGASVSVSGNTVAVGSPAADSEAGAAYVFSRSGSLWTQQQKLIASDFAILDVFGYSVAVDGEKTLVGSPGHTAAAGSPGAAYVYEPSSSLAAVWVGLKNSGDVGTNFDLRAEVLRNGSVIGSGQIDNVSGGTGSDFGHAILRSIDLALPNPAALSGDTLSIRILVRIGATGHRSGTARLWYGDAQANSHFDATVNGVTADYFLRDGFALGTSAGPGPKKTIDVFADRLVGGNPFKPFGIWSVKLP
jgi:hypothetical protein